MKPDQPAFCNCATSRCGPSSLSRLLHRESRLVRFHLTRTQAVRPDASHPGFALDGLHQGRTGKFGLGAISPHHPRGLGWRLSFSLFNAPLFASLIAALLKSSQPRAGPGASLRSAEAGERSRAAHSKQRLLVVCLKRPAAFGRWRRLQRLAPQAGLKASRRQFASFLSACVGLALPSVGWLCMLSGKGSFCARKPMQSHAFALPYLRWARWHDPATACFAPLV